MISTDHLIIKINLSTEKECPTSADVKINCRHLRHNISNFTTLTTTTTKSSQQTCLNTAALSWNFSCLVSFSRQFYSLVVFLRCGAWGFFFPTTELRNIRPHVLLSHLCKQSQPPSIINAWFLALFIENIPLSKPILAFYQITVLLATFTFYTL